MFQFRQQFARIHIVLYYEDIMKILWNFMEFDVILSIWVLLCYSLS